MPEDHMHCTIKFPEPESTAISQVELPLGATEDRICGTIDVEKALQQGVKAFEPGLLVCQLFSLSCNSLGRQPLDKQLALAKMHACFRA